MLTKPITSAESVGSASKSHFGGWMPPLDGLRGLAILMVMLFHFGTELNRNKLPQHALKIVAEVGWTGVDLFFVLSGFLITGILLDSREADNYFSSFYFRRVLRIFPVYYFSLLLVFFLFPILMPGYAQVSPPPNERIWYFA
jgi:peptidoglycan/LPS O-acetylase OafA/YrhL